MNVTVRLKRLDPKVEPVVSTESLQFPNSLKDTPNYTTFENIPHVALSFHGHPQNVEVPPKKPYGLNTAVGPSRLCKP